MEINRKLTGILKFPPRQAGANTEQFLEIKSCVANRSRSWKLGSERGRKHIPMNRLMEACNMVDKH